MIIFCSGRDIDWSIMLLSHIIWGEGGLVNFSDLDLKVQPTYAFIEL